MKRGAVNFETRGCLHLWPNIREGGEVSESVPKIKSQ